jgi:hypothetical protein
MVRKSEQSALTGTGAPVKANRPEQFDYTFHPAASSAPNACMQCHRPDRGDE